MSINYTKLAILLLRIHGTITIVSWIPQAHIAYFYLFSDTDMPSSIPNYGVSILLQPFIGIILLAFSVPIAQKIAGILDRS